MNHPTNRRLDRSTMQSLQDMLWRKHAGVQLYRQAFEIMNQMPPEENLTISLRLNENTDRRRYNLPTSSEIAVIIPGSGEEPVGVRDIILRKKHGGLQRINELHPLYEALHFVLLFPTGQLGWYPNLPLTLSNGEEAPDEQEDDEPQLEPGEEADDPATGTVRAVRKKRKNMSQTEYFANRFHPRENESNHIFKSGRLFQEFIVDAWAATEQYRLRWMENNQKTLRADVYQGLVDSVAQNAALEGDEIGQRTILPSSFSGSTHNMIQLCQDALAINRHFKGGDLFVTITVNPNAPEIQRELLPGQTAADRPDLITRVFNLKVKQFFDDVYKHKKFGNVVAHVRTTEFQKRGFPHIHVVLFLHHDHKLRTPEDVDSLISAEFPDQEKEPELYALVLKHMVHNPCGADNPHAPCMQDGKCSKNFPKPFRDATTLSENSYAVYKRRNDGRTHTTSRGEEVDNRWVVPYSPYLLWRYRCHINVESVYSIKSIKYIYKYVYKGHDRTTMEFGNCKDEIKLYLDARFVTACECLWRIFQFAMHSEFPNVVRLQLHLPGQHLVVWDENAPNMRRILETTAERKTTLMAYFEANEKFPEACELLYQEMPNKFVWDQKTRQWKKRIQNRTAIG